MIKQTRPIVIVDEPQSVDGGLKGAGKEALNAMSPLCTLRYSATHTDKHHMVYRLDAVSAYEKKLVKQIEVASATLDDAHNKPYARLVKVNNKRGNIHASVELDVAGAGGKVLRKTVNVYDGDDLEQITKRSVYAGFSIGEIHCAKGKESLMLRLPGSEKQLYEGEAYGDVDPEDLHRHMIRRTIREHLDKELRLRPQGIKVLSLFFIDSVEKYRQYTSDGHAMKGCYAKIFEDELRKACTTEKYKPLFALDHDISAMHDGYFSIDKKGGWTNTAENNAGGRENAERAYNLIMKDKEKLLAMRTPLKFIFSHSALKEGWDNPNVFQICNLRDMNSERERRQTIGRGLRLCVNQEGVRVRDERINTLTVIATESYESFAENLQKEIIAETGIRFGYVEVSQLAAITTKDDDGKLVALGSNASMLYQHLKQEGYLSASGEVQDALRKVLKDNTLQLPEQFAGLQPQIIELLKKVAGKLEVKNANERIDVKLRKDDNGKSIVLSDDFKALWDRIKHKTVYQVEFDNQKLIQDCVSAINGMPAIAKTRLQWRKADVSIGLSGVSAKQKNEGAQTLAISEADIEIPDVLTELQDRTQLTRRTLVNILTTSSRLEDLSKNPQQFIKNAGEALERAKRKALVEGIKYQRLGEQHVYAQELFEDSDGYLKNIFQNARKAIYENVSYDSEIERQFTQDLEANDQVKMYVKLPSWFEVPTPLGSYNPDWAILLEDKDDGQERLYFVVETKGSLLLDDLRNAEAAKIKCGKEHFKAIADANERPAKYIQANSVDSFFNQAGVLG